MSMIMMTQYAWYNTVVSWHHLLLDSRLVLETWLLFEPMMQMQTVDHLHLSDQQQDCHCVVNVHSNRNVFSWRLNTLWSVKS